MSLIETRPVAERFVMSLEGLCRAVAARVVGRGMAEWMILLVWQRVKRVERQVLGLLARFREGRLRVRVGVMRSAARESRGGGCSPLPRGFAWLLPLVPCEAACFAGQIRAMLGEPEMVALLAAAPQARRVLGPLCRMLGIEAAVLMPCASVAGPVVEIGAGAVAAGFGDDPGCVAGFAGGVGPGPVWSG